MIIEIITMLVAIPVGYLLAFLAKDELADGRKWFLSLMAISLILGLAFLALNYAVSALTFFFIFIATSISAMKSQSHEIKRKY